MLTYIPINTVLRQEIANEVTVKDMVFQDSVWIDLKQITQNTIEAFSIDQFTERPYEYFNDVHIAVTFSLNQNKVIVRR